MNTTEDNGLASHNELVRWLRLLALPLWARLAISLLISSVIAGALALLAYSAATRDGDLASSAIALLTISLPILLLVIALVFGQNSDLKLRQLTTSVLSNEVPSAIRANLGDHVVIEVDIHGCCADYVVTGSRDMAPSPIRIAFSLELNVYKVNVCFWLNQPLPTRVTLDSDELSAFRHVFSGATAEGYRLNEIPVFRADSEAGTGIIFFRVLSSEFLLQPSQRLYFVQDLSFFVRGVIDANESVLRHGVREIV